MKSSRSLASIFLFQTYSEIYGNMNIGIILNQGYFILEVNYAGICSQVIIIKLGLYRLYKLILVAKIQLIFNRCSFSKICFSEVCKAEKPLHALLHLQKNSLENFVSRNFMIKDKTFYILLFGSLVFLLCIVWSSTGRLLCRTVIWLQILVISVNDNYTIYF